MRKLHAIRFVVGLCIGGLLALLLSGCATAPQFLAGMYDNADPCQQWRDKSRPLGDQIPSWCGAGGGTGVVTRDYYTGRYIYRTK